MVRAAPQPRLSGFDEGSKAGRKGGGGNRDMWGIFVGKNGGGEGKVRTGFQG